MLQGVKMAEIRFLESGTGVDQSAHDRLDRVGYDYKALGP